jgi:hypothetical protein
MDYNNTDDLDRKTNTRKQMTRKSGGTAKSMISRDEE